MKVLFLNKKFNLNYLRLESFEVGIVLDGNEVKSIVNNEANIDEAFALIKNNELFILNMYVHPYKEGSYTNLYPTRKRKLLAHSQEIQKIIYQQKKQRIVLIPTKVYLNNDKIKIDLALATPKKAPDKRQDIKKRDADRINKSEY